jgi:hypothetical protein
MRLYYHPYHVTVALYIVTFIKHWSCAAIGSPFRSPSESLGVIQVTKISPSIVGALLTQQRWSNQYGCCANLPTIILCHERTDLPANPHDPSKVLVAGDTVCHQLKLNRTVLVPDIYDNSIFLGCVARRSKTTNSLMENYNYDTHIYYH